MKTGVFIIPTGIGASIGGFAGDASIYARKIAKKHRLIVNPNVVNAACFSGITENMLYVEGYILDEFFKGNCRLLPPKKNKLGIIFDKEIKKDVLNVHINTINAVKIVYGVNISEYIITEENVGVEFFVDKSGASTGNVKNLNTLKQSAEKLIAKGCNAIAIVCRFPDEQGNDYANGIGVDPVGGVEAIISHFISKEFKIPCAHAPAFDNYQISSDIVDPRCAAEYITPTFLPCILLGLDYAPQISRSEGISVDNIDFLAIPYNAAGSIPVLEMHKRNKKIFAVKENKSVLNVTPENLSLNCDIINSYDEITELLNEKEF